MRHLTLIFFFAAALVVTMRLGAADVPPDTRATNRDDWKKLSSEDRAKEAEKRRKEFHQLTPEQKEAKRKEFKGRLDKRLGELRCKQTNGTISADETRELSRREHLLKRFEQAATNAPAAPKP